ncbi:ATP-binding protein [Halomicroarcula sp. S1AR25-4]|uniref:ATP-binding protein n=1 Tax=Haloarcula sp. S1AR25-4 TaxID=2950538 RepID=UPI002874F2A7|nr:ATP-binding protein [Halomicroarcula sp. S1AR25-4]MDS0278038.1 ATP-binding protein [Halomicroarcula sp. S1AR25-4]
MAFVGDSGTGKTKLARGTVDVTPTSQYKSADNCTVAGLTAAATHEDRFDTSKWTLTGGALVRADGGHAVIDELDKAGDEVQDSLQETMSEQQVSVSKASIDATLPARCSVMLVANPNNGRFDISRPLDKQIDIKPAIWSRLDIIVPFVDQVDREKDEAIVEGILNRAQEDEADSLDEDFITKYVSYARRIDPMVTDEAREHLKETYHEMRDNSVGDRVAVGTRQFEGMVRIAEASARVRLSEDAELEDAKRATDIMDTWMSMLMTDNTGSFSVDAFHEEVEERSEINSLWRAMEELDDGDGADRQAVQEIMEERYGIEEAYQTVNKHMDELEQVEDDDGNKILLDQR